MSIFECVNKDEPCGLNGLARPAGRSLADGSGGGPRGWEAAFLEMLRVNADVALLHINPLQTDVADSVLRWQQQRPNSQILLLAIGEHETNIVQSLALHFPDAVVPGKAPGKRLRGPGSRPQGKWQFVLPDQDVPPPRLPAVAGLEKLSPRECQVIDLLSKGLLYKEISEELKLSYATISTHARHIYRKLKVHSRAKAVAKYLGQNIEPGQAKVDSRRRATP